jgi:hypothetical protein
MNLTLLYPSSAISHPIQEGLAAKSKRHTSFCNIQEVTQSLKNRNFLFLFSRPRLYLSLGRTTRETSKAAVTHTGNEVETARSRFY